MTRSGPPRKGARAPGLVALLAALLAGAPAGRAHAPHDVINEIAISPAFAQDRTLFASITLTDHTLFARSLDGGVSWQVYALPMMASSELTAFAFSPEFATDGIAFAATSDMGLWRTTDRGDTWTAVNTNLCSLVVRSVAVSPGFATDQTVLAATNAGCARSTDGGLTWTRVTKGLTEVQLQKVTFASAGSPQPTAYIAGKTVFCSRDGGLTWTALITFVNFIETLVLSPGFAADQTLALGFGRFGGGVRVSTNGGASFQICNAGLADLNVFELVIADDGTTFAATKDGGCYRAPSPAGTWELKTDGFEHPSPLTQVHNTEVVVSPQYSLDRRVFVAGYEGFYRSSNCGDHWRQASVYTQYLNRHIAFSPQFAQDGLIFMGNYGGGVFVYEDQFSGGSSGPPVTRSLGGSLGAVGATQQHPLPPTEQSAWDARADTISTLFCDALAISPDFATDQTLFYGYADLRRSTDAGLHWTPLPKPAGVTVVRGIGVSPDFATDRTVIFGSGEEGIFRSTDAGDTWSQLTGGLPPDVSTLGIVFSPDFAADGTVFLATQGSGVWRSTDGGDSWGPANLGLGQPWIRHLAVSPDFAADRLLFAGTPGNGVFVSHDGGDLWEPLIPDLPPGAPYIIESVVFSPEYATDQTVFVATLDHRVFRRTRGGPWQPASSGLPAQLAIRTLEISPGFAHDRTLVAGTFDWVWITRDAGETWSRLPGWIRADDGHPAVFHSEFPGQGDDGSESSWHKLPDALCHGNAYTGSAAAGDWEEYEFRGSRIEWYANTDGGSGIASVSIDGAPAGSVDLWSEQPASQQRVFSRSFPGVGAHVIRITNSGFKNPASSGFAVKSDGYAFQF